MCDFQAERQRYVASLCVKRQISSTPAPLPPFFTFMLNLHLHRLCNMIVSRQSRERAVERKSQKTRV